ncbi:MAG: hypothetical protein HYX52_06545 [Chloroflexi bacterium]|nr:hypothetical protein [Chloroflexota bacterium]
MHNTLRAWRPAILPLLASALLIATLAPAASAQTADGSAWSAGPSAVGTNTYAGFVDGPTPGQNIPVVAPFTVRGWVVDTTAQGWAGIDEVQVWDGPMNSGGTLLGKAAIAQTREDVSRAFNNGYWSASGFSLSVPANKLGQGQRQIYVYAHSQNKGFWFRTVSVNGTANLPNPSDPLTGITKPQSSERVRTDADYIITGYSFDRNASPTQGSGVDRVEVYLDYPKFDASTIRLGAADLGYDSSEAAAYGIQFSRAGWQLRFSPTKYKSDSHQLFVYARSSVTGRETVTQQQFTIFD